MCFYKTFRTIEELKEFVDNPLVAKRDKTVYKVLFTNRRKTKYVSACFNFAYKKGFHYYENFNIPCTISSKKGQVRLFYPEDLKTMKIKESLVHFASVAIYQGFHSYITKEEALYNCTFDEHTVVKMVIPEGALYYEDKESRVIVSNQIVFPH